MVRQDTSILVEKAEPASMPRPDGFVFPGAQWRKCVRERSWPEGSPVLAVEVCSPSNRRRLLQKKIDLFLRNGSAAVWIVFPDQRSIEVCTAEGRKEYRAGEAIPLRPPLPPERVEVSEIFEALD